MWSLFSQTNEGHIFQRKQEIISSRNKVSIFSGDWSRKSLGLSSKFQLMRLNTLYILSKLDRAPESLRNLVIKRNISGKRRWNAPWKTEHIPFTGKVLDHISWKRRTHLRVYLESKTHLMGTHEIHCLKSYSSFPDSVHFWKALQ